MTYRDINTEEREALEAFAAAHGRRWKHALNYTYWFNARTWEGPVPGMGSALYNLRNSHGPTWLYDVYKLPKPAAAAQ